METHTGEECVGRTFPRADCLKSLDRLPTGAVAVDGRARIVHANRRGEELLGRPLAELKGRSVQEAVPNGPLRSLVVKALLTSGPVHGTIELGDGARTHVCISARHTMDPAAVAVLLLKELPVPGSCRPLLAGCM